MQFLVLLHDRPTAASEPGTPEWDADLAAFDRFGTLAGEAIAGGEALAPETIVIRHGADGPLITDGPFTETAELLGGYFVLEAEDRDAVLELAAAIPTARTGTLEVRPIVGGRWAPGPTSDASPGQQRYVAMLHGEPSPDDRPGTDAWERAVGEHAAFERDFARHLLGGAALQPPATATTLRVRDDRVQVTDGPFTETTEVVGGWYVLGVDDRDQAIEVASAIPVGTGAVELRPVVELG